ncbi:hypothetical protein ACFYKX_04420 [Cytobacillus sp. FJAT-54145]|uniref:Uncharacterized protein n=1 Tax=Cytobacillus spartinae TaxID=3299023 RepID=A0ABW6KAP4_9BACI
MLKEEIVISDQNNRKSENIFKNTSNQANELVHKTVDSANKIVKTVSGEGGLVGKAADASSNVLKNTSSFGNEIVGKTVDTSSKVIKGAGNKVFGNKKKN